MFWGMHVRGKNIQRVVLSLTKPPVFLQGSAVRDLVRPQEYLYHCFNITQRVFFCNTGFFLNPFMLFMSKTQQYSSNFKCLSIQVCIVWKKRFVFACLNPDNLFGYLLILSLRCRWWSCALLKSSVLVSLSPIFPCWRNCYLIFSSMEIAWEFSSLFSSLEIIFKWTTQ